jgi:hypothetical protein
MHLRVGCKGQVGTAAATVDRWHFLPITHLIHEFGETMTATTSEDGPSGPNERSLDVLKKREPGEARKVRPIRPTQFKHGRLFLSLSSRPNSNMAVFSYPLYPIFVDP